jgi:hypothetical protein
MFDMSMRWRMQVLARCHVGSGLGLCTLYFPHFFFILLNHGIHQSIVHGPANLVV